MRLAILSAIHGNPVALETVLADLRDRVPDAIVNLGDGMMRQRLQSAVQRCCARCAGPCSAPSQGRRRARIPERSPAAIDTEHRAGDVAGGG